MNLDLQLAYFKFVGYNNSRPITMVIKRGGGTHSSENLFLIAITSVPPYCATEKYCYYEKTI